MVCNEQQHKSILASVHESAADLHVVGLMNDMTMREFDVLCLPAVKVFSVLEIKDIRLKNRASHVERM